MNLIGMKVMTMMILLTDGSDSTYVDVDTDAGNILVVNIQDYLESHDVNDIVVDVEGSPKTQPSDPIVEGSNEQTTPRQPKKVWQMFHE